LRFLAPRSSSSNGLPSSLRVASAMTSMFGSAIPCRRAAKFGVSPNDRLLLCGTRANEVADHHQPGCDADTGLQLCPRLEPCHCSDQLQSCPHRPLGVVLMGLRVAEIHQDAVAHVFSHEPAARASALSFSYGVIANARHRKISAIG